MSDSIRHFSASATSAVRNCRPCAHAYAHAIHTRVCAQCARTRGAGPATLSCPSSRSKLWSGRCRWCHGRPDARRQPRSRGSHSGGVLTGLPTPLAVWPFPVLSAARPPPGSPPCPPGTRDCCSVPPPPTLQPGPPIPGARPSRGPCGSEACVRGPAGEAGWPPAGSPRGRRLAP